VGCSGIEDRQNGVRGCLHNSCDAFCSASAHPRLPCDAGKFHTVLAVSPGLKLASEA
jgi:hypothetical protein